MDNGLMDRLMMNGLTDVRRRNFDDGQIHRSHLGDELMNGISRHIHN